MAVVPFILGVVGAILYLLLAVPLAFVVYYVLCERPSLLAPPNEQLPRPTAAAQECTRTHCAPLHHLKDSPGDDCLFCILPGGGCPDHQLPHLKPEQVFFTNDTPSVEDRTCICYPVSGAPRHLHTGRNRRPLDPPTDYETAENPNEDPDVSIGSRRGVVVHNSITIHSTGVQNPPATGQLQADPAGEPSVTHQTVTETGRRVAETLTPTPGATRNAVTPVVLRHRVQMPGNRYGFESTTERHADDQTSGETTGELSEVPAEKDQSEQAKGAQGPEDGRGPQE